jgi:autotransporter-associated beta strand protein
LVPVSNVFVLGGGVTVDTGTNSIRIDQNLLSGGGGGGLTKLGVESLALNGNNTYTGKTWIQEGGLYGTGSFAGNVQIATNAMLSPAGGGTNIGTVTITSGGLTLDNGSTLVITLNKDNTPGQTNDYVNVTGGVAASAGAVLSPSTNGVTPYVLGDQFHIFPAGTAFGGTISTNQAPAGLAWSYNAATGNLLLVDPAVVTPPTLGVSSSGNVLTFTWAEAGFKLQVHTNALNVNAGVWLDYPGGGGSPVNVTNNLGYPSEFFRLSQ